MLTKLLHIFSPTCSLNSSTPDDVESFTDGTTSTEGENPTQTDEPLPSVMTPEVIEQTSVEESGETNNQYPARNRRVPDCYIPTVI